ALVALGTLGAAAAVARPENGLGAAVPSIVATVAGLATFSRLRRAAGIATPVTGAATAGPALPSSFHRRRFLRAGAGGAGLAAALLSRPLIERDVTLTCVSNPVGGRYIGNARWIGAPLADLLREAGVSPGADQIVSRSVDGFTVGTPTAVVMDGRDAMLAVAMNGEPLPLEHGFPVRMIVPGLYGYVSATKWLVDIELTTFGAYDAYWVRRGWAQQAPIKTESRIDTPKQSATVVAGRVTVAGIAWAQHRGIARVEVCVDGDWQP